MANPCLSLARPSWDPAPCCVLLCLSEWAVLVSFFGHVVLVCATGAANWPQKYFCLVLDKILSRTVAGKRGVVVAFCCLAFFQHALDATLVIFSITLSRRSWCHTSPSEVTSNMFLMLRSSHSQENSWRNVVCKTRVRNLSLFFPWNSKNV